MIFVCGRFDILHPGHVNLLRIAKNYADGVAENLIVAINSDKSCEAMGKPAIMEQNDRMSLISSLSFIDVPDVNQIFFDEIDAREVIKAHKEHCEVTWFLGDDHASEDFSGLEDVQIIFVKRSSHSSSTIKRKICQS